MIKVGFDKTPFTPANRYKGLAKYLQNHCCVVGFWGKGASKNGTTYKQLAVIHEYGTKRTPARPFMRPGLTKSKGAVATLLQKNYISYLTNNLSLKSVFVLPAITLKERVQREFGGASMRPLARSTMKRRRGGSTAKPLLDTGNLQRSISYAILNKAMVAGFVNA